MRIREYWEAVVLRRQATEIATDVLPFKYRKAGTSNDKGVLSLSRWPCASLW